MLTLSAGYWAWGKLYRETETDSSIKRVAKNSLVPMVMALANRLIDFAFALLMLRILQPRGRQVCLCRDLYRPGRDHHPVRPGDPGHREVSRDRAGRDRYLSNMSVLRLYLWLAALPVMGAILALYAVFGGLTLDVIATVTLFALGTLISNLSDGLTAIFTLTKRPSTRPPSPRSPP